MSTNGSASPIPNWNRVYYCVFRLDRLAASIRGRQLTFSEDQAVSTALNMSIYAFASQWAQPSQRTIAKYPFHSDSATSKSQLSHVSNNKDIPDAIEFDRTLQVTAWHEARKALQSAGEIESFRVALAQIVFALTQKPAGSENGKKESISKTSLNGGASSEVIEPDQELDATIGVADQDLIECEDLLSKLDLVMDADGPPVHLEKGLRLIYSLRSRMTLFVGKSGTRFGLAPPGKERRSSICGLGSEAAATVDLLFWLGVMLDTLSAAMHKRPLVVSDEDSGVILSGRKQSPNLRNHGDETLTGDTIRCHCDDYFLVRQQNKAQDVPTRWPCSFDEAAVVLCDAAPIKISLFRRVTRIQTLLARSLYGEKIERSLRAALDVYDYWNVWYAPFIRDCIQNNDNLPPHIQSWYVCLTGHWHLATLLLADLIDIVDRSHLRCRRSEEPA